MQLEDLPQEWAICTISDVADVNPKKITADFSLAAGFVPMSHAPTDFKSKLLFEEKPWGEIQKAYTNFQNGDVIFAKVTPCFENGKAAIVDALPNGIGAGSSEFYVLRPNSAAVLNRTLFALIKTQTFAQNGAENMTGAVGLRRVPRAFVEDFRFPLPPLAEQKVIADKLDTLLAQVDNTKACLERIPQILKSFRQSVLAAAVSGKLTEEWRMSNLMTIKEWKNVSAADVCLKITDGEHQTPKRQNFGQMLLSAKNIRDGYIDYQNHDLISQQDFDKCLKRCYAETGDVLIVSVGATIGRVAIKKDDIDFALVRSVGLFKVDSSKVIGEYLLYTLQTSAVQKFINEVSRGNAQPTLYISAMSTIPVYLPPLKEQTEIVRRVEQLFAFADSIEQKANSALARVNNLTQSILAKAFRGELTADWRAANLDLISGDNSAEALLAKIKAELAKLSKKAKAKA